MTAREEAASVIDSLIREYEQALPGNSEIRPLREQRLAALRSVRALLATPAREEAAKLLTTERAVSESEYRRVIRALLASSDSARSASAR